jgi:ribosomal protein S18 acetylase RimI-like enzyme
LEIRPFEQSDYDAARALWERSEGVGLSGADERAAIFTFLKRNPNISFVAITDGKLIGTILCGHDGRRGLIHHLVTDLAHRRRGVASALLKSGLKALRGAGIDRCHLLVFRSNEAGLSFWRNIGAEERKTLALFSMATSNDG